MNKCSDCGGDLEEGCLIDFSYGKVLVQRYARSLNIPHFPIPTLSLKAFEANFEDSRRVLARRCKKCNKISLYAQDFVDMVNMNQKFAAYTWIVIFIILVVVVIGLIASLGGY